MREIKFRGLTRTGRWVYGSLVIDRGDTYIYWRDEAGLHKSAVLPDTIGQYTGLKSKSGVEIYEGDIVKAWSGDFWLRRDKIETSKGEFEIFYVQWNERELRWRCQNDNKGPGWYPSIEDNPGRLLFEVIGNIHENPELLNEEPERAEGAV